MTLWFVVAIFLQTVPGDAGGPIEPIIAIIAVSLLYLVPLYIVVGIGTQLADGSGPYT